MGILARNGLKINAFPSNFGKYSSKHSSEFTFSKIFPKK